MLLGVAGPGDSSPSPLPVPHIIQGVLGIRFTHIHYTCNMQVFQLFSPVFAVFRAFLHHFPHFCPPGPTCRAELGAGTQKQGAGRPRGAATPTQGGLWPPPHRAGPPARSAAAESAGGSRADRGHASPAQSDRRAASPAGAGRGGARPPWRVPPGRAGGTDYPEPPEARTGGAGGGA